MRWRTSKSTSHCLAISTCRTSTSARPLQRANSAERGTPLALTLTARCSWLSSPVLRQEEIVRSLRCVLEAKSCGAETVPELVTSPQTTLPVDTPPLVKVQSRLSQSSGPAEPPR